MKASMRIIESRAIICAKAKCISTPSLFGKRIRPTRSQKQLCQMLSRAEWESSRAVPNRIMFMLGKRSAIPYPLLCLIMCVLLVQQLSSQSNDTGQSASDQYTSLVAEAKADLDAGNAAKALEESQGAIKLRPNGWQAYITAAVALEQQEMFAAAVGNLRTALGRAPEENRSAIQDSLYKFMQEAAFFRGIGPYRFGMTPDQVNAQLPVHFLSASWTSLPIASEFGSTEVRYFWLPLPKFGCPSSGAICQTLATFAPCWTASSSYVVFLFTQRDGLIRISTRLIGCPSSSSLQAFAASFGIGPFNPSGPSAFKTKLHGTVLEGNIDNNATFDIYVDGSPLPLQPRAGWISNGPMLAESAQFLQDETKIQGELDCECYHGPNASQLNVRSEGQP